ncbi:MAG TPA: hypothetical protein V6D17_02080 [Candidatus Obscuribacterales bacterium]
MFVPETVSLLRGRIRRLAENGQQEEAMAAMRRFLELEREAALGRCALQTVENAENLIKFPFLRPIS